MATIPQNERLDAYLAAIRSSPHNLVSRRAEFELESRHLPEALALARLLPPGPAKLVDVGSGGGFPGVVIAVARPDLEVTLVEATGKKAHFLQETVSQLRIRVHVLHGRIEELVGNLGGSFDLATARAVAPLRVLVPWVVPVLRQGGRLFAVKGERWREEVAEAAGVLRKTRARVVAVPPHPQAYDPDAQPPLRVVIIERDSGANRTRSTS